MKNSQPAEPSPGITLGDIYFVLFRHKWKIVILSIAGIASAIVFNFLNPPMFQSEAELFIRYVLDTRSPNPTQNNNTRETAPSDLGESIIKSEMQILTSFDLFQEVATNVGPEKILARVGGGSNAVAAANVIRGRVSVEGQGSVIHIVFRHPDPDVVQPVLNELIRSYHDMHFQVHQMVGSSDDFLTEETARLRLQIAETEADLLSAKTNAGIVSIENAEKSYSEEISRIREQLHKAEADLAERQAVFKSQPATTSNLLATVNIPADQQNIYQKVCGRLEFLQKREHDYLSKLGYTEENKLVKEVEGLISDTQKQKDDLEKKNPALAGTYAPPPDLTAQDASSSPGTNNPAALLSRINFLKMQLDEIQNEAAHVGQAEAKISDLQRKKQIQEGNYQYFATSLEQARIDEALGPGRISNIKTIQSPTPPFRDRSKNFKMMMMMIFGGILGGVGWAILIEFYFDRSVKRPIEIESRLHLPLFLSIPDINNSEKKHLAQSGGRQLQLNNGHTAADSGGTAPAAGTGLEIVSWEASSFLNQYYDALRDRLVVFFESINLTRKPKLVAVTSTDRGAGVSTIASGLAASLSETGDGRVLLVSMERDNGVAQQFFHGKPGCKLDDVLEGETRSKALVQENLYVVEEGSNSEKLQRALPKRFAALVPKLKASDYDYIIFDMPPVSQTSITTRLAGFMDMMLLVVEAEKTDREMVRQASALLAQSKATVGAVLNRTKKYVPTRLHQESLGDV